MTREHPLKKMGALLGTERSSWSCPCSWGTGHDLSPSISHAGDPKQQTARWQGLSRPHPL